MKEIKIIHSGETDQTVHWAKGYYRILLTYKNSRYCHVQDQNCRKFHPIWCILYVDIITYLLVGECCAFLASGSDPGARTTEVLEKF